MAAAGVGAMPSMHPHAADPFVQDMLALQRAHDIRRQQLSAQVRRGRARARSATTLTIVQLAHGRVLV